MSLLNKASFLVTPNGYKEDKLYAAIPTNGNGDMTFTRATTATRVNEAGLVELVPYNLLSRSEEFDNASWGKTQVNVTANALTAPNGTLTADFLIPTAVSSTHTISQAASGTATFTIFAKQGGYKRFRLLTNTSGNGYASFNLETGLVTTASGTYYVSSGIEDFGNGWYRCRLVLSGAEAFFTVAMEDASGFSGAWTGDGTSGIYFWGAQVVEGTSALTYQKTVDRLDIPRIDYTGGGCPSILLEPQRTNLLTYSEQFDNAYWAKLGATVTANNIASPSGILNADRIFETATNNNHGFYQNKTLSLGTTYAMSCYVKKGNRNYCGLQFWYNITNGAIAFFNLDNGTLVYEFSEGSGYSVSNSKIEDVGNGWYRLSATFQVGITDSYPGLVMASTQWSTGVSYSNTYLGDSSKYIDVWGFQLEAGAYPTSYIPTTTATVTRNADVINRNNIYTNNLITAAGGTWFIELDNNISLTRSGGANVSQSLGISDNSSSGIVLRNSGTTRQEIFKYVSASPIHLYTTTTDISKIAIKWNGITADVFENGIKVVSATSFTTTLMQFFQGAIIDTPKYIKQMALFPTPLSDDQCIALTTL
jgi:hypothetical protein